MIWLLLIPVLAIAGFAFFKLYLFKAPLPPWIRGDATTVKVGQVVTFEADVASPGVEQVHTGDLQIVWADGTKYLSKEEKPWKWPVAIPNIVGKAKARARNCCPVSKFVGGKSDWFEFVVE